MKVRIEEGERQRRRGESMRRSAKKKLEIKIAELEAILAKERAKAQKYKKRYQRAKKEGASTTSPRTAVKALLGRQKVRSPVKKALLFHAALVEDIRSKYKKSKANKEKQLIDKVVTRNIVKKYKLQSYARSAFGYSKKRAIHPPDNLTYNSRRRSVHQMQLRNNITSFFLRDDVSRMTAGRKQTITLRKKKMQKRLLTDTRKKLYQKFLSENLGNVSYTTFCRCKPFWVVSPSPSDRDSCLCKKHENLLFMTDALQSCGLLHHRDIEQLAQETMCDSKTKACAYGECRECLYTCQPMLRHPGQDGVTFCQWTTEKIERDDKSSTITVKKVLEMSEDELSTQFHNSLFHFRRHIFNIKWQYDVYRKIRNNLRSTECLIHIDFSENYSCKYHKEIQSVHFGGSHQQASLHTGVLYVAGDQAPQSFCTISPSRRHDPVAIWAHLDPILNQVREQHPDVCTLHFFSDAPATQYRQKGNFFHLSTEPFKYGFKQISWHFFEASHGKGAPDGVGGALKRTADKIVAHGEDIPNAQTLYEKLKGQENCSIDLHFIPESDIEAKPEVPAVTAVKGTTRIHQAISMKPGEMMYRDISWDIKWEEGTLDCSCFNLQKVSLLASDQSKVHVKEPIKSWRPEVIEEKHIGEWCVVNYDNDGYPGIILDVEEHSVKVKCVHNKGINKFCWPSPRDDINWYGDWQILCLMPEPQLVNRRAFSVEPSVWKYMEDQLQ
ncbi:uncharacterized protein LOC108426002 isoform X1 [Pygocentrus nattereri]|uniref:uncharacterized protein LOC108426002 isoform X1 n=1 Tax=Pygocentrus nattereri TaxID=42514 RepID=UPI001890E819|nr:uncharacterized protein LOC108426002 isoform X1 [Pygocentrus nattereri]